MSLGLAEVEEPIEHVGLIRAFRLDLEGRWSAESGVRRIDTGANATVLDILTTVDAEPAVVWAHLTSASLRALWDGPTPIGEEDASAGAGAECVTGHLAAIEEIVDWQPYQHVGWSFDCPSLGAVVATADLVPLDGRTRLRLRWSRPSGGKADAEEFVRVRRERKAAIDRLGRLVAGLRTAEPVR